MALFGSTGLPIIVAVTSVAVEAGQMTDTNASVLVAGGASPCWCARCWPSAFSAADGCCSDETAAKTRVS